MIELRAGSTVVVVDDELGGRVAQVLVGDRELLVERPADAGASIAWGCYPMVPWAGRVRAGRFRFGGAEHQLTLNHIDHRRSGTAHGAIHGAIHGVGWARPWSIVDRRPTSVDLAIELGARGIEQGGWPFGGTARQRITVVDRHVRFDASVTAGDAAMPAEIGWHPWFRKPRHLDWTPGPMYERGADGLPTGRLVPASEPPWDDCFVSPGPVVLHDVGGGRVTVESDCDHWVVYDEPAHATCVEPQSGPPDAFNLRPRTLAPHETLARWMTMSWSPSPSGRF